MLVAEVQRWEVVARSGPDASAWAQKRSDAAWLSAPAKYPFALEPGEREELMAATLFAVTLARKAKVESEV